MRELSLEEIKELQLDILDVVKDFCDKNGINYFLNCGTLIGAIRHKGYIPWDDDIDLGMLREDYDKFLRLFNESNERYKAYSVENSKTHYYPFMKVVDTSTLLYEVYEGSSKTFVNLDVFVYDNVPNDKKIIDKMFRTRNKNQKWQHRRLYPKEKIKGNILKRVIGRLTKEAIRILPKGYFTRKIVKNSKRYINEDTGFVGNFTGESKVVCSKKLLSEFIETEFEGRYYKIPKNYHEWLTMFYGDYMQLPPEEKRVLPHTRKAFINE